MTIHWIVARSVSKSRESVLIATLTTVVSRIDMIAPSTTTLAIASSLRSSPSLAGAAWETTWIGVPWGAGSRSGGARGPRAPPGTRRSSGSPAISARVKMTRAGDVGEQRRDAASAASSPRASGAREQDVVAAALVGDDLLADQRRELLAVAQLADQPAGEVGVVDAARSTAPSSASRSPRRLPVSGSAAAVGALGADRVDDDLLLAARPAAVDRRLAHARARSAIASTVMRS